MKYRLYTFAVICSILSPALSFAESDWHWLHPTPTGARIRSSFFIDSDNGWISTGYELCRTCDGGDSWEEVWTGLEGYSIFLRDIFFIDSLEGWAVAYQLILHTTDGGMTWDIQFSTTQLLFYAVYFVDSECGCAVGSGSTVYRTNNGGDTWYQQQLPDRGFALHDVFFVDSTTGWITGNKIGLFFTNTSGEVWILQPTGITPKGIWKYIFFNDSQTGWAIADTGEIIATYDGGENWVEQNSTNYQIWGFDFADQNHGVACCRIKGGIMYTDDGGTNWIYEVVPHDLVNPMWLWTVSYPDVNSILTAGEYGLIFRRIEGVGWEMLSSHMIIKGQRGICQTPPGNIWVCGLYNKVMHSADDGSTWVFQTVPSRVVRLSDICFLDSNIGYACGLAEENQGVVIRTSNGGNTWEDVSPPIPDLEELYSLDFVTSDRGAAVGTKGEIIRTFDGGNSWVRLNQITSHKLLKFRFGDADHGWAVGEDGIVLRCDFSSDSWSQQYSSTGADMYSLFALNADTAWAAGWNGNIIRTLNGGDNWYKIGETGNDYWDIWFFNGNYGYFAGAGGVWITQDGAQSLYPSPAALERYIRNFCFSDTNNGWGSGYHGGIFRFGDGGTSIEDQQTSCMPSVSANLSIYPNPFESLSNISFILPEPSQTRLSLYDLSGRLVMALDLDYMNEGEHHILFNANRLQPGIYLIRLEYNGQVCTSSCVKLR